jgi:beta-lactamase class C
MESRRGFRSLVRPALRPSLLATLLTLTLASAAQTPVEWRAAPADPGSASVTTAQAATTAPASSQPVALDAGQPIAADDSLAHAPAAPATLPLPAGFDVRRFELMAQALVAEQRIPGLALAIVKDGKILSARGYGITDVQDAEPVNPHTVFRLASLSKSFAGTVTGMLVSEGALRWDSRIADFMPNLRFADPTAARELTVAEVLSHRVGLTHNAFDRDIEAYTPYRDLVQRFPQAPMKCRPGECYAYQNVAFSLIGDVVYAASGQFYEEAVARRVFKPLGMNDASLGLEGISASPSWAKPHVRGRGGWVSLMPKPTYYHVSPAAGVNASISDMAQWLLAHTGHRPDVLPEPLLATLHAPVVATPGELRGSAWRRERLDDAGYGLGWRVYQYAGHRVVFHGGAVQGYRGAIALLPDSDLGIAILWNSESSLPGGLLPTILDSAVGLPYHAWLDLDLPDEIDLETRYASSPPPGVDASISTAAPE